jgi:hypothetical protein
VSAVIAFRGRIIIRMNVDRVIRTSLHTRFASDASIAAEIYDPVFSLPQCCNGADFNAWCVCAVIAALHGKNSASAGEFSLFNVLHPRSIDSNWQLVFLFACNGASVASDAFAIVNDEAVFHGEESLYR